VRLAKVPGGRGEYGLLADEDLLPGPDRGSNIVFADEIGRCIGR
jgi:hypothetical protein